MNLTVVQYRILRTLSACGEVSAQDLAKALYGESWQPIVQAATCERLLRSLERIYLVARKPLWRLTQAGRQVVENTAVYERQTLEEIARQARLTAPWIQHLVFKGFSQPLLNLPGVRAFLAFLEGEGLLEREREAGRVWWMLTDDGRTRLIDRD